MLVYWGLDGLEPNWRLTAVKRGLVRRYPALYLRCLPFQSCSVRMYICINSSELRTFLVCSIGPHAIAAYDFEAAEEDELGFFKDDIIVLLEKGVSCVAPDGRRSVRELSRFSSRGAVVFLLWVVMLATERARLVVHIAEEAAHPAGLRLCRHLPVDDDWYRGRNPNGQEGIFPKDFVEIVKDVGAAPAMARYVAGLM